MKEFNLDAALNGEPKISIEDLPKPFKPEENEVYYVISPTTKNLKDIKHVV